MFMKVLELPPYTDDYPKRQIFENSYFCDRRNGQWLFFNNGQKIVIIDSFAGTIRELNYTKDFIEFLSETSNFYFVPQNQHIGWLIVIEDAEPNDVIVNFFQLSFDYSNALIESQKQKSLRFTKVIDGKQHVLVASNFLMTLLYDSKLNKKSTAIYKLETLPCNSHPDFIWNGHIYVNEGFWHHILGNRMYYFSKSTFAGKKASFQSYIEAVSKLHFYDFDNRTKEQIQLINNIGKIEISNQHLGWDMLWRSFEYKWEQQRLFFCFSMLKNHGFQNVLMELNLELLTWNQIKLPKHLSYNDQKLSMDICNGILVFTSTHARNPILILDGNWQLFKYFDESSYRQSAASKVYRITLGRPEKLTDLAYFCLLNSNRKFAKHLNIV